VTSPEQPDFPKIGLDAVNDCSFDTGAALITLKDIFGPNCPPHIVERAESHPFGYTSRSPIERTDLSLSPATTGAARPRFLSRPPSSRHRESVRRAAIGANPPRTATTASSKEVKKTTLSPDALVAVVGYLSIAGRGGGGQHLEVGGCVYFDAVRLNCDVCCMSQTEL
jgi:hypothetical protein